MSRRRISISTSDADVDNAPFENQVGIVAPYVTPRLRTRRPSLTTGASPLRKGGVSFAGAPAAAPESSSSRSSSFSRAATLPSVAEASIGTQAVGSAFMQMRIHPDDLVVQIASMKILVNLAEMGGGYAAAAANHEVQDGCKATLIRLGKGRTVPAIQIRNMYAKYRRAIAGSGVGMSTGAGVVEAASRGGGGADAGGGRRSVPMTPRQKMMMTTGDELRDRIEAFLRERQRVRTEAVAQEWLDIAALDRDVESVQQEIKEKKAFQLRMRNALHYEKAAQAQTEFDELHAKLAKKIAQQNGGVRQREQLRRANSLVSEAEERIVEQSELMQRVASLNDDARAAQICAAREALIDIVERVKQTCDFMVIHTPPAPIEVKAVQGDYRQVILTWKDGGNSCDDNGAAAVRYRVYLPPKHAHNARRGSISASTPRGGRRPAGWKAGDDWHSVLRLTRRVKWVNATKNGLKCAFETNTMSNGLNQTGLLVRRSGGTGTSRSGSNMKRRTSVATPRTPGGGQRGGVKKRSFSIATPRHKNAAAEAAPFGTGGQLNVPPPIQELKKVCRVTFENLDAVDVHRFCVAAVSARGMESAFSEPIEIKPHGEEYVRPPNPRSVRALRKGLNQLMVMWSAKRCTRGDPNAGYIITSEPADSPPIVIWGTEVHVRGHKPRFQEPRRECLVGHLSEKPYTFTIIAIPMTRGDSLHLIKERYARAQGANTDARSGSTESLYEADLHAEEADKMFFSAPSPPSKEHSPHGAVSLRTPKRPRSVKAAPRGDGESVLIEWVSPGPAPDGSPIVTFTVRINETSRVAAKSDLWIGGSGEPWSMTVHAPRTHVILSKLKCQSVVGGFEIIATCRGDGEGGVYQSRYDGPIALGMSSEPSKATIAVRVSEFIEFDGHTGPWQHMCDFKWKRRTPWLVDEQTAFEEQALVHMLMQTIGTIESEEASKKPWSIAEMETLKRAWTDETAKSDLEKHVELVTAEKARQHVALCKLCVKELGWEEIDADAKVAEMGEIGDVSLVASFPDSATNYVKQCNKLRTVQRKRAFEEQKKSAKHQAAGEANALDAVRAAGAALNSLKNRGMTIGAEYQAALSNLLAAKEHFTKAQKAKKEAAASKLGGDDAAPAPDADAGDEDQGLSPEDMELYEQERWERIARLIPGRTPEDCQMQVKVRDSLATSDWDFNGALTLMKTGMKLTAGAVLSMTSTVDSGAKKGARRAKRVPRARIPTHKNGAPVWEALLPDKGKSVPPFVEPVHNEASKELFLYRDQRGHWLVDSTAEGVANEWGHIGIVGIPKPPKLIGGQVDPETASLKKRIVQFFDDVDRHVPVKRVEMMLSKYHGREKDLVRKLEVAFPGYRVPQPKFLGGVPPEITSTAGFYGPNPVPTSHHLVWRYRKTIPTEGSPGRPMRSDADMKCTACLPTTAELGLLSNAVMAKFGNVRAAFEAMNKDGDDNVEREEINAMLDGLDLPASFREEVDALIAACDTNMDGQISFQEFWEALYPKEDDEAEAAEDRDLANLFASVRKLVKEEEASEDVDQVDLAAIAALIAGPAIDLGAFQVRAKALAAAAHTLSLSHTHTHIRTHTPHAHHTLQDIFDGIITECDEKNADGEYLSRRAFWEIYDDHEQSNC